MALRLIALLEDADLDLSVSDFGFKKLAAETLGDAATDDDGTKAILESAVNGFIAGGESVALLDGLLAKHFAEVAPAVEDTLVQDTLELDKDLKTGAALLKEAGVETPAPAPAIPATQPGGGGRGGPFDRGRIGRFL